MADTHAFASDIVRIIWARIRDRAKDLHHLVEAAVPFDGWLESEAFLASREQQESSGFCEVTLRPTYGSEGVTDDNGQPSLDHGALRVGGSGEPGDHRWLFAEFVLLLDSECRIEEWSSRSEAAILRLLRLGWKRSASVLFVVAAASHDRDSEWGNDLTRLKAWDRPMLTETLELTLPEGGTLLARAFDVKRNPTDTLTTTRLTTTAGS